MLTSPDTCKVCSSSTTPSTPLQRCGRCKSAVYCSPACQTADWKSGHKLSCRDPSKPSILVIALRDIYLVKSVWGTLLSSLRAFADITIVTTPNEVTVASLRDRTVVILADGAAATSDSTVAAAVTSYAKNDGGTLLMAAHFSSSISPPKADTFLRDVLGLPWRFGPYHRSDYYLKPGEMFTGLSQSYSQKAVSLMGVRPKDAVYVPHEDSITQSMVFPPEKVDMNETPTAWGRLGEGWVGWVGDVNAETETIGVILRMCGL